jgi:hypothetical protein
MSATIFKERIFEVRRRFPGYTAEVIFRYGDTHRKKNYASGLVYLVIRDTLIDRSYEKILIDTDGGAKKIFLRSARAFLQARKVIANAETIEEVFNMF